MKSPPEQATHNLVKKYYDNVYYHKDKSRTIDKSHWHALRKRLNIDQGTKFLDIACGSGEWLDVIDIGETTAIGLDISFRALLQAKSLSSRSAKVVNCIAENLPFVPNSFDFISCLGSLEHFVDPTRALDEMLRVGTDDAKFLFLVPNSGFLPKRLGLFGGTDQAKVKEDSRALSEWVQFFRIAGLETIIVWRDLHLLSRAWIWRGPFFMRPLRLLMALLLYVWPLTWQYQLYFLCKPAIGTIHSREGR